VTRGDEEDKDRDRWAELYFALHETRVDPRVTIYPESYPEEGMIEGHYAQEA